MGEAEFYRGDETRWAILSGTLTSAVDIVDSQLGADEWS